MGNDWSAFQHVTLQNRALGMGYLVWNHIPYDCLVHPEFTRALHDTSIQENIPELVLAKKWIEETIAVLRARNIKYVRIGLSWCEWEAPGGPAWISWCLSEYSRYFSVLPCFTYTPPELSETATINGPPKELVRAAEALYDICATCGSYFSEIELWNEPNLDTDWLRARDPDFRKFARMIACCSLVAHHFGKRTVLGGAAGVNEDSLHMYQTLAAQGLFHIIDVASFHDLRGTWSDHDPRPHLELQQKMIRKSLAVKSSHTSLLEDVFTLAQGARSDVRIAIEAEIARVSRESPLVPIWLTEYGLPVAFPEENFSIETLEEIQVALFAYASVLVSRGILERVYWYTHKDKVVPSIRAHTTGWEDELQYYYGDTRADGTPRKLGRLLEENGIEGVVSYTRDQNRFPLVDQASLKRTLPGTYKSNTF